MKRILILLPLLAALAGCTTVKTVQNDESPERTITTKVTGTAWFSSSANITNLKALNTDKTQSVGASGISQQGATNAVASLEVVLKMIELLARSAAATQVP
jgi:hypothetical protein